MDINDLYAAQKIKQSNKMEFFNSILQKCHHRIKTVAQKSETFCFYIVPEFSLGTPLYNVYQCCQYIISHLKNGGFNVLYIRPNLLYISWDLSQYLTPNQIQQINTVPRIQSTEQIKYNIQQNLLKDLIPRDAHSLPNNPPSTESDNDEEETQIPPSTESDNDEEETQVPPLSPSTDESETQTNDIDPEATQLYEVTDPNDEKIFFYYKGNNYYLDINNNVYEKDEYESYTLVGKLNDSNYQIDFV